MVKTCAVKHCTNYHASKKSTLLHRIITKDKVVRQRWLTKLQLEGDPPEWKRVCGLHFTSADYVNGKLKGSAIPSQNIPDIPTHQVLIKIPNRISNGELSFLIKVDNATLDIRTIRQGPNDSFPETKLTAKSVLSQQEIKSEIEAPVSDSVQELKSQIRSLQSQVQRLQDNKKSMRYKYNEVNLKFNNLKKENFKLSSRIRKLKADGLQSVKEASVKTEQLIVEKLRIIFTQKQIDMILLNKSKTWWSDEDISRAIALRGQSTRAYNYIRDIMKIPLPCLSTIQNWTKNILFAPGLLYPVLNLLKEEFALESPMHKQCVLSFDEMQIDSRICYDPIEDEILGPRANFMLVVIRGLFKKWKQPIYYEYDVNFNKDVILKIINAIYEAGITVKAVVSDLAPKNRTLWNELGICMEKTHMIHPETGSKIYFFSDMPHNIKLLRNCTMDYGVRLASGIILCKEDFSELLKKDCNELKINFKLTQKHLDCEGRERQRVYLATQVFSNKTADAIKYTDPSKSLQADFIRLVNHSFDIFNSREETSATTTKHAFGVNSEILNSQQQILTTLRDEMKKLRAVKKTAKGNDWDGMFPFQKGYVISITSLLDLFDELSRSPMNIRYITTRNLNQDVTENSFSVIRSMGGPNDHPTMYDVKNRLKLMLLSWNCKAIINASAKMEDGGLSFVSLKLLQPHSGEFLPSVPIDPFDPELELQSSQWDLDPVLEFDEENWEQELKIMTIPEKCELGGEEYVAGFVAKKFNERYPAMSMHFEGHSARQGKSWTQVSSRGGLTVPSYSWLSTFRSFEVYFKNFHDTFGDRWRLNRSKNVMKNLGLILKHAFPDVPPEAIDFYVKTRTFIRIKWINEHIVETKRKVMKKNRKHTTSSIPSSVSSQLPHTK